MKKTIGLSLIATAIVSGAFASEVKTDFTGDVKAFYETNNAGTDGQVFDKASSAASLGISFGATVSVGETTNAGVKAVYLNDAGLNGTLTSAGLQNSSETIAFTEAYIAKRFGDTGFIVGRQAMKTPMLYSDDKNKMYETTVNAFTAMNKSIDGITLVGALVSGANDSMNMSEFDTYHMGGSTYVAGIMANPVQDVKANAWFYKVEGAEKQILWADAEIKTFTGANVFVQGAMGTGTADAETTMYGVKADYDLEGVKLTGAYNHVEQEIGGVSMRNLANGEYSNLYTEMFRNTAWIAGDNAMGGAMAATDIDSVMVSAEKEMGQVNYKVAYGTDMEDNSQYNVQARTAFGDIDVDATVSIEDTVLTDGTEATVALYATYKF